MTTTKNSPAQLALLRTLASGARTIKAGTTEYRTMRPLVARGELTAEPLGTGRGFRVKAVTPLVPELVETQPGTVITRKASAGVTPKLIKIDREWDVLLGGEVVGAVRYTMITRERRSAGRTYVNSRWESPGWQYRGANRIGHWFEASSKAAAIETVVSDLKPWS